MAQVPANIQESAVIHGLYTVPIRIHGDERGRFREIFRQSWFPWIDFSNLQSNFSESKAHVLRGLHYHHRQIDYWFVTTGMIRVGLADLRRNSPTYRATQTLDIGEDNPIGVFIPIGVAHGFVSLTDACLIYYVNQYYDNTDEHGVAWDDPDLNVAWNIENPILSGRDLQNPRLRDITPENHPR